MLVISGRSPHEALPSAMLGDSGGEGKSELRDRLWTTSSASRGGGGSWDNLLVFLDERAMSLSCKTVKEQAYYDALMNEYTLRCSDIRVGNIHISMA